MLLKDYERQALGLLYSDTAAVIQFFIVMSRFEYAIKRAGYIQERGSVDWWGFARTLGRAQDPQEGADDLCRAIMYLDRNPPRKLNADMTWGDWERPDFGSCLSRAFMSITQVRNNLFHGRKGNDQGRNDQLIKESLVVLEFLLARDKEIQNHFLYD